jgi:hypothetical protein
VSVLEVRENGAVTYDGIVVGTVSTWDGGARLTLDLGWAKAAGLHVTVLGDRAVDKARKALVDR